MRATADRGLCVALPLSLSSSPKARDPEILCRPLAGMQRKTTPLPVGFWAVGEASSRTLHRSALQEASTCTIYLRAVIGFWTAEQRPKPGRISCAPTMAPRRPARLTGSQGSFLLFFAVAWPGHPGAEDLGPEEGERRGKRGWRGATTVLVHQTCSRMLANGFFRLDLPRLRTTASLATGPPPSSR